MNGTPHTRANTLAALTPTNSDPMSPGPMVAATRSIPAPVWVLPADSSASVITGVMSETWARPAISGTTPP